MKFRIRCSAIGEIMAGHIGLTDKQNEELNRLILKEKRTTLQHEKMLDLQDKKINAQLPQGVQTYLKKWMKEQAFGRQVDFGNKYTRKGHAMEEPALESLGLKKNITSYYDDFFTGTPDAIHDETVIDIKNSWDHNTFPMYENDLPNRDYWWQMQGYMHLTKLNKAEVKYFLQSWPDEGINYEHVKMQYRIKTYHVQYDPEAIERIKERVLLCQEYVDQHYISVEYTEIDDEY